MLNSWLKLEPEARAIPLFMVNENAAQLTDEEAHLMRLAYQALGKGGEQRGGQDDEDWIPEEGEQNEFDQINVCPWLIVTSCVFCRCRHGTFNPTVLSL
jgi:hypothetical protein